MSRMGISHHIKGIKPREYTFYLLATSHARFFVSDSQHIQKTHTTHIHRSEQFSEHNVADKVSIEQQCRTDSAG